MDERNDTPADFEAVECFTASLPLVNRIVDGIARRYHLTAAETDDFRSTAYLKLIADDYAVLRKFTHRSSLRTYLTVVLQRAFLDARTREWGKWRPSARGRRSGKPAMRLEQLIERDGVAVDAAVDMVSREFAAEPAELYTYAEDLRPRERARHVAERLGFEVADTARGPDEVLLRQELREPALQVKAALERIVAALPPEDQAILRSRFWNGEAIADIARSMQLSPRRMYARMEAMIRRLRDALARDGFARMAKAVAVEDSWKDLAR
jgi:RNA polymerase sigma factor (sigma-70 family)